MRPTAKLACLVMAVSLVPALLAGCATVRGPGVKAIPARGGVFESAAYLNNVGTAAPDFTATDVVTGQTVTLAQFKGKTVLLNFVNYGCNAGLGQSRQRAAAGHQGGLRLRRTSGFRSFVGILRLLHP